MAWAEARSRPTGFPRDARIRRTSPRSSCQSGTGQSLADVGEGAGGDAEIENAISWQLELPLKFLGPFFQPNIGLCVVVPSRQVKQVLRKGVPRIFDEGLSGMFDDAIADAGSEFFIAHGGSAQADHDIVRRE